MLGTIVNTITVLLGGTIGLFLKKGIPASISEQLMKAIGLCTIYLGVSGFMSEELNLQMVLVMIISMVLGTLLGSACDLDGKLQGIGTLLENRVKTTDGKTSVAEGFVNACLVFCVGSMTILGAIQSGTQGDNSLYYTKAILDLISSIIFASALGVGVLFSAAFVLLFQGGLTILMHFCAGFFSAGIITLMNATGSLILVALAFNLIGITKLKLMNYIPSIFMPLLLYPLSTILIGLFS